MSLNMKTPMLNTEGIINKLISYPALLNHQGDSPFIGSGQSFVGIGVVLVVEIASNSTVL
jgi:hypothetical protein